MRAVVQRVTRASVSVGGDELAAIGRGFVVLIGVGVDDDESRRRRAGAQDRRAARVRRRGRGDEPGLADAGGAVLAVSQFTLLGDVRKGRRPSFIAAARGERAEALYERVVTGLRAAGLEVGTGRFGATMAVALINDGPVTILIDTKRAF